MSGLQGHNHAISVANQDPSSDRAPSDEYNTDTTTLASTLRDHVYENGRRYHSLSAGKYAMPNDEPEQDRLDMLHHAMRLTLGGALHVVDLPVPCTRVLDCGTGTGMWATAFADEHPNTRVTGIDLSPIQPSWIPSNCTFLVDDLEKPWLFPHSFDFIHSASLAMGIRDWDRYLTAIFDHLRPGGVVQLLESQLVPSVHSEDDSIPEGGAIERYQETWAKAFKEMGGADVAPRLGEMLREKGFVDVRVVMKKLPIGPWAKDGKKKELGKWGLAILELGLKSFGAAVFARQVGLSPEEGTRISEEAFQEFKRRSVHTYFKQWYVSGRKPGA